VQWGFSLGTTSSRTEERCIMVAGTLFDEGPPDATQSLWRARALDFQGMGKSCAMGQGPTPHGKAGILPMPAHRTEFPPAIPRRVASQQSPLPRRRIRTWNQEPSPSSSSCFRLFYACRKNSHTERPPRSQSDHLAISPFTASANIRTRRTSSLTSRSSHVANIAPIIRSRALSTASVTALPFAVTVA
jgi:hypothetical protein